MERKKRYACIGLGARGRLFYLALATDYKDSCDLVALCDINKVRLDYAKWRVEKEGASPNIYHSDDFDKMIENEKPDVVIVTTIDRTHHKYIIRALELGCDVITEKPMTVDTDKCQQIIDAVKRTGKKVRVAFNYRYAPYHSQMRQLIMDKTIGDVKQIHFEWLLDTNHGADYFRRWHRDKRNSGGLLVHKATHHFDLVNFWMNTRPKQVFAYGELMFYGRENAENRGVSKFYYRGTGSEIAKDDPFALDLNSANYFRRVYHEAECEDGYLRDQSVFGDGISIEDVMNVLVKYENGAQMSYSLNAFSPKEGFRVVFTGTKGRIEMEVSEVSYINGGGDQNMEGASKTRSIKVFPMFEAPYDVKIDSSVGGHGGGDARMLRDLFGEPEEDPLKRAADYTDGAMSILTGIAANKSIASGLPINIKGLVEF